MNVRELIADAARRLAAAGVASPRVDAELLLAGALGTSRTAAVLSDEIAPAALATFEAFVARRSAREPLQHILGEAPFRHVVLAVGPGVFVPRPETELLVDAILPPLSAVPEPLVVDLCAGSGALAMAVADELPAARVVAVERSPEALVWLTRNAAGGVQVVPADICDPDLLPDLRGRVDAVVSNPPYVPSAVQVSAEVHADPAEAVFAGPDGLDLIPTVIRRAAELLRPGGVLAMEHDETQDVRELFSTGTWTDVVGHEDLSGRPRFVTARRGEAHPQPAAAG
jgi:release factor glutamine methyltransferase